MTNRFIKYFEDSFRENWDLLAMTNYVTKQTYAYKDVARKIAKLHILFRELNIQQDDKIALLGPNSEEWSITFLSVVTYGAVVVPILEDFQSEDIVHIINHSESKFLFSSFDNWQRVKDCHFISLNLVFELSKDMNYRQLNGFSEICFLEKVRSIYSTLYPGGITKEDIKYTEKGKDELMVINYTSGTTGFIKGVMLSGDNFCCILDFSRKSGLGVPGDKVISVLPLAHTYGCVYDFFLPLIVGAYIVYLNKVPSPKVLMKAMEEEKPEWISTVPLFLEAIYKKSISPLLNKRYLSLLFRTPLVYRIIARVFRRKLLSALGGNLKLLIIGGAALNQEVEDFFHKINFPFTVGYGMTECSPLISVEYNKLEPHSVGKVIDDVTVKIDSDDPFRDEGEILVKGRNVMKGYYNDAIATRNAFTEDGWFKTGDVGVFDECGNLFLKGRKKNMILSSTGQNIFPEEIEEKLNQYDCIVESLVIGRKNKLIALVYLQSSIEVEYNTVELTNMLEKVRKDVNRNLPNYEYINAIEIQKEPFEKTPKKSIKRYLYS